MSNKKIILIILASLLIVTISFLVVDNLIKNHNMSKIKKEVIANIEEKNNEIGYTLTKKNEISELLPKNITEITFTNYYSNLEEKNTYKIQDLDIIKEFTNLLYTTTWKEIDINNYPCPELECNITFIGDTTNTLQLILRGTKFDDNNPIDYGIISIRNKNTTIEYEINQQTYNNLLLFNALR